ncbi:phospholipase D family protein [Kribbella qitaiheensis]|uniref:phospholipase D family protein n=1 Tax=Kribbella qitaiheensis TaxID=1544730 RepID=UPI00361E15E5
MSDWFLTPEERGNTATEIDRDGSWTDGNLVRPLVHGAVYFQRLYDELCVLKAGDRVYFTDWRGDADEAMYPDGPTVGKVLCDLATSGVEVRGLLWRSHSDHMQFNAQENQRLGRELNEAGGEVLLDQRIRRLASHHQKLFVIRHRGAPEQDLAFVGGIDLSHQRRDDARHRGDPQQAPMDERYGSRPPWHDVALELRGPIVGDLLRTFVERWDDSHPLDRRTPYRVLVQRKARMPRHPSKLPEAFPDPPVVGEHAVQVLRTYGHKHPPFPFAAKGEYSVARGYRKAFGRARRLIYLEDQYLWSEVVAEGICRALEREPGLLVVAVVPRYPDQDERFSGPPARYGQLQALRMLRATAPNRVGIYDLENDKGVPIYVHAKVCVVDDEWLACGSANLNRRSWTNDSELACSVVSSELAASLRTELWTEHLGTEPALDPLRGFDQLKDAATALDSWHASGEHGPRPPGQLRHHNPEPVTRLQSLWARRLYDNVYDPDGRPRHLRRRHEF